MNIYNLQFIFDKLSGFIDKIGLMLKKICKGIDYEK